MRKFILTAALGAALLPALSAPAVAQSYDAQRRWDAAQQRYQAETDLYNRERDRYFASRDGRGNGYGYGNRYNNGYNNNGYGNNGYNNGYYSQQGADPYATSYDASRYYRDDPRYQERRLTTNDEVYRGSDGRYYCKRSDGTTGLIVGAAAGGVLGNVIDGGRHRTGGTLIGGALGALLGRSVEQNSDDFRCR